jgi:hypothetical protein
VHTLPAFIFSTATHVNSGYDGGNFSLLGSTGYMKVSSRPRKITGPEITRDMPLSHTRRYKNKVEIFAECCTGSVLRRFQVPQVELNVRPINTVGKESKYNLCIQKVQ